MTVLVQRLANVLWAVGRSSFRQALCNSTKMRVDSLPYIGRLLAIVHQYYPDVGQLAVAQVRTC